VKGKVVVTISRGRVVWESGKLNVKPGTSRYVHLPTHGPLFEGLDKRDAAGKAFPYGPTPVTREAEATAPGGSGKEEL
jgi:dihydropyrimidinase